MKHKTQAQDVNEELTGLSILKLGTCVTLKKMSPYSTVKLIEKGRKKKYSNLRVNSVSFLATGLCLLYPFEQTNHTVFKQY